MSKKVKLMIEIDEQGKIFIKPIGTTGKECLDLMSFLDKIEGFSVETLPNENLNKVDKITLDNKNYLKDNS